MPESTFPSKDAPVSREQAMEALDAMDDFARMGTSVDAYGPREVLRRFIEQAAQERRWMPLKGWKLVPIEPTRDMWLAGATECSRDDDEPHGYRARGQAICVYEAMIAAAPPHQDHQEPK